MVNSSSSYKCSPFSWTNWQCLQFPHTTSLLCYCFHPLALGLWHFFAHCYCFLMLWSLFLRNASLTIAVNSAPFFCVFCGTHPRKKGALLYATCTGKNQHDFCMRITTPVAKRKLVEFPVLKCVSCLSTRHVYGHSSYTS